MDYIVMDLEWNQNPYGKSHCHTDLTFEIIEIGAVRVSDDRKTIVRFRKLPISLKKS